MERPLNNQKANLIFEALKKNYTLVGAHRVKAWHAWLVLGIFAGAVGATVFIANRSGEVEKSQFLSRSSDGGRTWITEDIKKLITLPYPFFLGHDAKIAILKNGNFAMVMNVSRCFDEPSNCQ